MTPTSQDDQQFLEQTFVSDAKVLDSERGYISVSSFNLRMKPAVLSAAARLIASAYTGQEITVVHGIPSSGTYLATAVSLALSQDVRLHASRKDSLVPASWKETYHKEVRSFTASSGGFDVYAGVTLSFAHPGDKVLLVDDVCASGGTATALITGLQERGISVVGFAVLFDKVFQGGLEKVAALGVSTFSCVRVAHLGPHDQIRLHK